MTVNQESCVLKDSNTSLIPLQDYPVISLMKEVNEEDEQVVLETLEGAHLVDCVRWAGEEILDLFIQTVDSETAATRIMLSKDEHGNTILHICASNDALDASMQILDVLRRTNVSVDLIGQWANCANCEGNTPLHWASVTGSLRLVRFLREEFGASTAVENAHGRTPICEAELHQRHQVVKYFIETLGGPGSLESAPGPEECTGSEESMR